MKIKEVNYLPSGRIFLAETNDSYLIEFTEMRDVSIDGKVHKEVRETFDPKIVWKHLVPYKDKWLLTVSTQKGCAFNCSFCDVAPLEFKGNLLQEEIEDQIKLILVSTPYVTKTSKAKIGFARMGEPAMNLDNVLNAMKNLPLISKELNREISWLPCFNTIVPKASPNTIEKVIDLKENIYNGHLHFQISCNSTNEETRHKLFNTDKIFSLEEIIHQVNKFKISNRTITLNFIVMEDVEVSVEKLKKLGLSKEKFSVKLIPLNSTNNANRNNLKTYANYSNYERLLTLKDTFEKEGIPVIVDAIAQCEEGGLCCGQLAQCSMDK